MVFKHTTYRVTERSLFPHVAPTVFDVKGRDELLELLGITRQVLQKYLEKGEWSNTKYGRRLERVSVTRCTTVSNNR